MLFNSWEFAAFLPIVLLIYYALNRKGQNVFLIAASYFFYGWWDYRFCALLAISTLVAFTCGLYTTSDQPERLRRRALMTSLFVNLGILASFKYFNFFSASMVATLDWLGLRADAPTLRLILPVGISFYTFQTLSYTIDVYRGKLPPTRNLIDFALYVSFFPQLVAGPIERATRLLPQIQQRRAVSWDAISSGCVLILLGLFRKIAIADGVAPHVNLAFFEIEAYGSLHLFVSMCLFSVQIYCDFAGYTDIARGVARLLGVELMENFRQPYFSRSPTEFWRRWHVSLSTWLRDYLYIPLGGNRHGRLATYRNLMLTMLLGGLWHGANWTFVAWGGLHGIYLAIHRIILRGKRPAEEDKRTPLSRWPVELCKMLLTFQLVTLTWVFFRAQDFGSAWAYLTGLAAFSGGWSAAGVGRLGISVALLLLIDVPQYVTGKQTWVLHRSWATRSAFYSLIILAIFWLRRDGNIPFIYFQF